MKPFLLIAVASTGDWIDTFSSEEEALQKIEMSSDGNFYTINGYHYDWYKIVDLREWINRT